MLEFYFKYNRDSFNHKSKLLAKELTDLLLAENIPVLESDELQISIEYKQILGNKLFSLLNNLYFTLRGSRCKKHSLLNKYLPESKNDPTSDLLFADFFSGAGGLSQGLINAGFQPAFVNDNYTEGLETYYFNHTLPLNRFYNGDIKDLVNNFGEYKHLFKKIKILAGGPPCQGFSTANRWNFEIEEKSQTKRFIEDPRNELYRYFVQLIGLIKPDFFIMENVRGMKKVEEQIEEDIQKETGGKYSFYPLVLNAENFDIPQNRTRYILIGARNFMAIESIKENITNKKKGISKYKLKDALYGLPVIGTNPVKLKSGHESESHGFTIKKIKIKQNSFLKTINKNEEHAFLFNHKSRYNNDNDLQIFALLPQGQNSLHHSIQHLIKYKSRKHIFKDKYYKLRNDEVSKTITSHMKYDCHMYIHPEQSRGLSPREAARLQTFPDDYLFRGTLNDWYKQIGNAVPVKLAEIIGNEIMNYYR